MIVIMGVVIGGWGTSISEPNKVQQFQFQTVSVILFTGVQKLYGPNILHFYRVCYNFWIIYGGFSFFLST